MISFDFVKLDAQNSIWPEASRSRRIAGDTSAGRRTPAESTLPATSVGQVQAEVREERT